MSTESVGLTLVVTSIVICITCLMLHSGRHFTFRCCIRSKNYIHHSDQKNGIRKRHSLRVHSDNILRQLKRNESICRSCIVGIEDNFDFFPISFLLYNLFIILLCIIVLFKYMVSNNICSFHISTLNHNYQSIMDWIIVYSLIFLSLWEMLFNFHRFYTTYFASKKMKILNSKQIIAKFSIFAIPYITIFLLQIHVWYYFCPLVIAFYLIFNVINAWLFGHILIVQYRFVMGTEKYLTNIHDDMLESVYLMRKISLISCLSSTTYITLFTLFYNINIILFIPILWSISCICLTLNFVRNRQYIHSKYLSFQLWMYSISLISNWFCCQICKNQSKNNVKLSNTNNNKIQSNIIQSPKSANTVTNKMIKSSPNKANNMKNNSMQNHTLNYHKTQPQSKSDIVGIGNTIMLNDIEFKDQYENAGTPSLIISSDKPVLDNKNNTKSTPSSKAKWWNRIGTPLGRNKHQTFEEKQAEDGPLAPINTQISPNTLYNINPNGIRKISESSSADTIKKNQSRSKAMKFLGIASPASTKSISSKYKEKEMYAPPSTPMPALFSHLWENKQQTTAFPSKRPPGPETLYEDADDDDIKNIHMDAIQIVTQDDENNNHIMEERDEFNENEMLEMTNKFEKTKNLIRVSAKQPQLLMQRISINIDTPKSVGGAVKSGNNNKLSTPSVSRSGSKSPFGRKKADDKQVSLLMEEDNNMTPIKDDIDKPGMEKKISELRVSIVDSEIIDIYNSSESEDEPQVVNLPNHLQNMPINHQNGDTNDHKISHINNVVGEHVQSLSEINVINNDHNNESDEKQSESKASRFGNFLQKIPSPRSVRKKKKMVTFAATTNDNSNKKLNNKRIRSKSDAKGTDLDRHNMKHFNSTKSMTHVDGIIDGNPDVVSMFDVLAKHGFYSQQNVASAQQLKDYHMKL